jgi:serine/threonine protein phosphatase PrpC
MTPDTCNENISSFINITKWIEEHTDVFWLWVFALFLVILSGLLIVYIYRNERDKIKLLISRFMNKNSNKEILYEEEVKGKKPDAIETNESESIVATGTDSPKLVGQDACKNTYVEEAQAHIVAVADGLGSQPYAEKGSAFVVDKVVELLADKLKSGIKDIDFEQVFREVQIALDKHIEQLLPELPDSHKLLPEDCFGTTLIVGIDFPDRFVAAYAGNGAIFNISGYFADFPPAIYLPWNAINMLNPHTVEQDGREALYKLFSWQSKDYVPTVLEIKKNKDVPGEIFVLATDGVYSADHNIPGKDGEGLIWIPSDKTTELLYDFLKGYLLREPLTEGALSSRIKSQYLFELKRTKKMDDCTTVGIIITGKCLEYFKDKRKKIIE